MSNMSIQIPSIHAQGTELTDPERCHILSDDRRRLLLDILTEHTAGIGLEALAERVTDRTDAVTGGERSARRVAISLHHKHLPMLDDYDVVKYDEGAHWVQSR